MQAVIMVGGAGVRLRPFTYVIPKPLLPLRDTTILEYTVKSLCNQGIDEIFLLTSYQNNSFEQCHEYGGKYGGKVSVWFEGKKMGTAGGLKLLEDKLDPDFLVLNGDLLVRMNFTSMVDYHIRNKADITIGTTEFRFTIPHGVVEIDEHEELVNIQEKPTRCSIVNAGIYALNSSMFCLFGSKENPNYLDMPTLIRLAKHANMKVKTYDIGKRWLDTGELVNYERAVDAIEGWSKAIR